MHHRPCEALSVIKTLLRARGFLGHKPPRPLAGLCSKPFSTPNSDVSVCLATRCHGHMNLMLTVSCILLALVGGTSSTWSSGRLSWSPEQSDTPVLRGAVGPGWPGKPEGRSRHPVTLPQSEVSVAHTVHFQLPSFPAWAESGMDSNRRGATPSAPSPEHFLLHFVWLTLGRWSSLSFT